MIVGGNPAPSACLLFVFVFISGSLFDKLPILAGIKHTVVTLFTDELTGLSVLWIFLSTVSFNSCSLLTNQVTRSLSTNHLLFFTLTEMLSCVWTVV